MKRILWLFSVAVMSISCGGAEEPAQQLPEPVEPIVSAGMIERLDPSLDALVSVDAVIEHLADGCLLYTSDAADE